MVVKAKAGMMERTLRSLRRRLNWLERWQKTMMMISGRCNEGDVIDDLDYELYGPDSDPEEGEEQGQPAKKRPDPERLPSQEGIDAHEFTHILFRQWCAHCQRARCRNDAHRRKGEGQKEEDARNTVTT